MQVHRILYEAPFQKQFRKLPLPIQQRAVKTEKLFRINPFHPSLRLHELKGKLEGLWSISITTSYRIIFGALDNGDVLFISIGTHSIYEK